jgi:hypothetical protein
MQDRIGGIGWIVGGLGLVATTGMAAGGSVTIYPPAVNGLVALRLEFSIDEKPVATMQADIRRVREEPQVTIPLKSGFHRYQVRGQIEFADGRKAPVQGAGLIALEDFIDERLSGRQAEADPLGSLEALLGEFRAAGGKAELPRLERGPRPPAGTLAAAEARLGIRVPSTYRTLLELYGPFVFISLGDEGEEPRAALYPPDRLLSVPDWRREVRRSPLQPGDTPRARTMVAKLDRDVVVGHTFDTVWTLRAGSHPLCPGGVASLSGEFLYENEPGEDLYNEDTDAYAGYFGDLEPRCDDRVELLRDNLTAALASGIWDFVARPSSGALRFQHDEERSADGGVFLNLGE